MFENFWFLEKFQILENNWDFEKYTFQKYTFRKYSLGKYIFRKYTFGKYTFKKFTFRKYTFRKYTFRFSLFTFHLSLFTFHLRRPEIGNSKVWPTELPTDRGGVGARDTCVSKNIANTHRLHDYNAGEGWGAGYQTGCILNEV